jgi:hypothetical protein
MTKDQRTEIEAAAFRGLMKHLQERTDVQNIDLMNLAGFCRNCMSKWYAAEAQNQGLDMDYNGAQKEVYGMTIGEWKANHQTKASDEQIQLFNDSKPQHAKI